MYSPLSYAFAQVKNERQAGYLYNK
jgi:hypothetical protein